MDPLVLDLGRYERGLREQGFRLIAGVDEAGRGALAGPLVAAAVILPAEFDLEGINDSKVLTALQRDAAFERIVRHAVARSVCRCTPTRIDRRGLHKTNVWLLRRCITTLPVAPDYVLTDGFPVKRLGIPNLSIKKGDAVTASVAAASIVPMFAYVVETERRFYLANTVELNQREDGWVEVVLGDAWVWDMWRPARLVSNVRVLTRHDVNVEELRQQDTMQLPD